MKDFMDKDFLLSNETAKILYHDYAEKMPIIDYHCHINPAEIAENKQFQSMTEVWLGGDHYKWRAIRSNGVAEKYITGEDSTDWEKFKAWAEAMPKLIGNPLYHWTHLELKRYFGVDTPLNGDTAEAIWQECNEKLKQPELSVRGIIDSSNVKVICTTDDPADSLCYHQQIKADPTCQVKVYPAYRPDRAVNIRKPDFIEYMEKLGVAADMTIGSFEDVCEALEKRLDFFVSMGCKASDHGVDRVVCELTDAETVEEIFQKRMAGEIPTQLEADQYQTALLLFLGQLYHKNDIVMQLHYGVTRNSNTPLFEKIGADTGFDAIAAVNGSVGLIPFLDELNKTGELPKTILYSLNPSDNALIGSVIGCFQNEDAVGKIQHGSAWWFNDNKTGMEAQLISLANLSLLGNFVGMLTDSRSFLSYTRHEYFRRILCNLIGTWVENGEYPNDIPALGQMVQDISYNNTVRYFGFEL